MNQRGFSMIEMVVSLLVLAVLGSVAGSALVGGARAFTANSQELQQLDKLRYASERMAREIREIRRDPVDPSRFDILDMTDTSFRFIRTNGTEVTLQARPPLLLLGYALPAGNWTLTDDVSSMRFAYFQIDGLLPATSAAETAFVEIHLELGGAGNLYPQRTRVALRNRR